MAAPAPTLESLFTRAELTSEDFSNHGCPNYLCRKTWAPAPTEGGTLANGLKEEASLLPSPQSAWAEGCHHLGWPAWRTGHVYRKLWRRWLPPGFQQKWPKQTLEGKRESGSAGCQPRGDRPALCAILWSGRRLQVVDPCLQLAQVLVCEAKGFSSVAHTSRGISGEEIPMLSVKV